MVVMIGGRRMYLWRAVDDEGEVLDNLVQRRRNKAAAVKLFRKLMKKFGFAPRRLVTDKLPSYGAARAEIGMTAEHEKGLRKNNRAENSHQPVRTTGAQAAAVQIRRVSPTIRRFACRRLQHLQRATSSDLSRTLRGFRAGAMEQWRLAAAA